MTRTRIFVMNPRQNSRRQSERPSLFSDSAPHSPGSAQRRIAVLDSLDPGQPRPSPSRRIAIGLIGTAAALSLAAFWFHSGGNAPSPSVKPVAAAPAAAPPAAPEAIRAAPAQVLETHDGSRSERFTQAFDAAPTDAGPTTPPAQSERISSSRPAYAAKLAKRSQQTTRAAAKPSKPAQPSDPAPSARQNIGKPPSNSDETLLTALVSHAEATDAGPSVRRDVVMRAPGTSTRDLVARCDALGGLESTLCRKRICKGLWGRDAACPGR
jgi:hypothetical protein